MHTLSRVAGHVRDACWLEPGRRVLVRPDGDVAAVVRIVDLAAVEPHLHRAGVRMS